MHGPDNQAEIMRHNTERGESALAIADAPPETPPEAPEAPEANAGEGELSFATAEHRRVEAERRNHPLVKEFARFAADLERATNGIIGRVQADRKTLMDPPRTSAKPPNPEAIAELRDSISTIIKAAADAQFSETGQELRHALFIRDTTRRLRAVLAAEALASRVARGERIPTEQVADACEAAAWAADDWEVAVIAFRERTEMEARIQGIANLKAGVRSIGLMRHGLEEQAAAIADLMKHLVRTLDNEQRAIAVAFGTAESALDRLGQDGTLPEGLRLVRSLVAQAAEHGCVLPHKAQQLVTRELQQHAAPLENFTIPE